MKEAMAKVKPEENMICASPELTNESLTMIQKWAKECVKTDITGSFHYFDTHIPVHEQISLDRLESAKRIYIIGVELSLDHPVVNHIVQNLRFSKKIPVSFITTNRNSPSLHKVDEAIFVDDYQDFVKNWTTPSECVAIVSEKNPIWKNAKNALLLREACNAQGIIDLGIISAYPHDYFSKKLVKNFFIFGENPLVQHIELFNALKTAPFLSVQSHFMNETTAIAGLVFPMNFAIEIGGSYTSTFGVTQKFDAVKRCEFGWNDYQFYRMMMV